MTTLEMLEAVVKNPGTKYVSCPKDALVTLHDGILMRCNHETLKVSEYDIKPREIPSWIEDDVQWLLVKEPRVITGEQRVIAQNVSGPNSVLPGIPEGTWDVTFTATEVL